MRRTLIFNTGRIHSGYKLWRVINVTAAMMLLSLSLLGQNVQRDSTGNFHAVSRTKAVQDSTTTFTFTDAKGVKHPVYVGGKGAYFLARTSKSGKYYRQYLKTENQ